VLRKNLNLEEGTTEPLNGGMHNVTSSSAVAERLHDASFLSVVNFNSTNRQAQSSIVSYFRCRFTATYN